MAEPFPFEAVRDLIGILRALYAADKARGAGSVRLGRIRRVASELHRATALAREHPPNTMGHSAAWAAAEEAVRGLGDLFDATQSLEPMLVAAGRRVRLRAPPSNEREAARKARGVRS